MRYIFVLFFFLAIVFSCKKDNTNTNAECAQPAIVPLQPYSFPVWHPNGQLLGFNHTPLAGIASSSDPAPCTWYYYGGKEDSTGFYLMNKDGSGFRRITNFKLGAPAWSPDGKWIAFSYGPSIYKMPFDGNTFDTTQIIQLTASGANFFPSWTANSDTIYFDSNVGTNGQGYYVWKMASDGTGKIGFPNTGREPFVGSNNLIYYVRGVLGQPEIFSMNKDGSNQIQVTFNGQNGNRRTPKFWQGNLFYNDNSTLRVVKSDNQDLKLTNPAVTHDISINGEIVYSKMDYSISKYNKQIGTLWIMNSDGSNKRQLTFNNF
jgi:Tol biopolymer transport system component